MMRNQAGILSRVAPPWGVLCLLGGFILLGAGCGDDEETTCSADTCPGCCQGSSCLEGTANEACGTGGGLCTQCLAGTTCQNGQCVQGGSCTGCLDAQNVCQPGLSPSACGTGGGVCQVCGAGETCAAGTCQASCSHLTCPDGCCLGSTCIQPNTDQACGLKGAACLTCDNDETCVLGQCASGSTGCDGCAGCCFEDTCLPGNTTAGCGRDGAQCVECGENEACVEGVCTDVGSACNATNCTGCCTADEVCVTTNVQSESQCGKNGEACGVCDAAAVCQQGVCVTDQPCFAFCNQGCCTASGQCLDYGDQAADTCGQGGELCVECTEGLSCLQGQCVQDPVYEVWAISAVLSPTDPDGEDWDGWPQDPLPDSFVSIGLENSSFAFTSSKVDNTLTPNWSEKVHSWSESEILTDGLFIRVLDSDLAVYEVMGECSFKPSAVPSGDHILNKCGDYVTNLTLRFVLQ